jgi:hypothetical protein
MLQWEGVLELRFLQNQARGRHSAVGLATRYGLDGARIDSQWGRDFPHEIDPGVHPASFTKGTGIFPEGKAAGGWR